MYDVYVECCVWHKMMAMEEKYLKKETKCQLILSDFVKINAFHGGIGGKTWDEVQIWVIEFVCVCVLGATVSHTKLSREVWRQGQHGYSVSLAHC